MSVFRGAPNISEPLPEIRRASPNSVRGRFQMPYDGFTRSLVGGGCLVTRHEGDKLVGGEELSD